MIFAALHLKNEYDWNKQVIVLGLDHEIKNKSIFLVLEPQQRIM